jgi:hypothetical protein
MTRRTGENQQIGFAFLFFCYPFLFLAERNRNNGAEGPKVIAARGAIGKYSEKTTSCVP